MYYDGRTDKQPQWEYKVSKCLNLFLVTLNEIQTFAELIIS